MKFLYGSNLKALAFLLVLMAGDTKAKKLRGVTQTRDLQANAADVGCILVNGVPVDGCDPTPVVVNGGTEDSKSKDKDDKESEDDMAGAPVISQALAEAESEDGDGVLAPVNPASPAQPVTTPILPDVVGVALGTPSLSSLVDLLTTAGLVETLRSPGPFTVFAPINVAFPSGIDLLYFKSETPRDTLVSILTYHVVPGVIRSTDLVDGAQVATVQGSNVTVSLSTTGAMINNANVVSADIDADNGIIHLIDAMLTPS